MFVAVGDQMGLGTLAAYCPMQLGVGEQLATTQTANPPFSATLAIPKPTDLTFFQIMAVKCPTGCPVLLLKVVQLQVFTSLYQESDAVPSLQSKVGNPHPQQRFSPYVPFLADGEWVKLWIDAICSAQDCAAALRVSLSLIGGQPCRLRSALCLASSVFLKSERQVAERASWVTLRAKTQEIARMINKTCFMFDCNYGYVGMQFDWNFYDRKEIAKIRVNHQEKPGKTLKGDIFSSIIKGQILYLCSFQKEQHFPRIPITNCMQG